MSNFTQALAAEIQRLREALQQIATAETPEQMQRIARKALERQS